MDETLKELAKNIPVAVAMIFIVWLFLSNDNKREEQRIANAKSMEQERKAHDLQVNAMWATSFKQLVDTVQDGQVQIVAALKEHERASRERYEKMGITKDLFDAAKERLKK